MDLHSGKPVDAHRDEREMLCHYRIDAAGLLLDGTLSERAIALTGVAPQSLQEWTGRCIWDAISDQGLRVLQQALVGRLLESHRTFATRMRCDTPTHRILLTIVASADAAAESVTFTTFLDRSEPRSLPAPLVTAPHAPRAMLRLCAWCARLDLPGQGWTDIDAALLTHEDLNSEPLPQVSHVICETCRDRLEAEVAALG